MPVGCKVPMLTMSQKGVTTNPENERPQTHPFPGSLSQAHPADRYNSSRSSSSSSPDTRAAMVLALKKAVFDDVYVLLLPCVLSGHSGWSICNCLGTVTMHSPGCCFAGSLVTLRPWFFSVCPALRMRERPGMAGFLAFERVSVSWTDRLCSRVRPCASCSLFRCGAFVS